MKPFLIIILSLSFILSAFGQQNQTGVSNPTYSTGQRDTIKAANLIFQRPNSKWFLKYIKDTNEWTIYSYKREPIIDSEGRKIIPNIAFMVETIPDTVNIDVVTYSAYRIGYLGIINIGMFNWDTGRPNPEFKNNISFPKMQNKNAAGFKGIYKDYAGEHTVYVVYIINKKKGVQVIMDMTSELFEKYEKEFAAGLWSITVM
jgi:hypothetical protein